MADVVCDNVQVTKIIKGALGGGGDVGKGEQELKAMADEVEKKKAAEDAKKKKQEEVCDAHV